MEWRRRRRRKGRMKEKGRTRCSLEGSWGPTKFNIFKFLRFFFFFFFWYPPTTTGEWPSSKTTKENRHCCHTIIILPSSILLLNIPARREEGGEELLPVLSDEITPRFHQSWDFDRFQPTENISNTTAKKNLTNSNFILLFFKFWRRLIYDSAMGYYLRILLFSSDKHLSRYSCRGQLENVTSL
jgi:hypothetical protein